MMLQSESRVGAQEQIVTSMHFFDIFVISMVQLR
jgi:hypothetical protein